MSSSAIVSGVILSLLLLHFVFSFGLNELRLTHENGLNVKKEEMVPVNVLEEMIVVGPVPAAMNDSSSSSSRRRRLGSFQICALCTCCGGGGGGGKGYCLPSPCCYAINCNIPNRPFGFCAFTPKTCNCFGCHL